MLHSQFQKLKTADGPLLITGHTGFKGAWLSKICEEIGLDVVGLSISIEEDSLYKDLYPSGMKSEYFIDVNDEIKIKKIIDEIKPFAIIHLAAQSLVSESYKNTLSTLRTNILGTANILEAGTQQPSVKAILLSTTDKVYKNSNNRKKFVETDQLGGSDPYSLSKVGAESVINAYQLINKPAKKSIIALRAGNVIGGGDHNQNRLLPDLLNAINSGNEILIRSLNSTRPWQHVLDVINGYLLTLELSLDSQLNLALNFSPLDDSKSVLEVIQILENLSNKKIKFKEMKIEEFSESKYLELDSSMARQLLNWKPKFDQEEAIAQVYRWNDLVMNKHLSKTSIVQMLVSEYYHNN